MPDGVGMLMRRRAARDGAGFTLVELIVSIGILGVVFLALVTVMFGALTSNKQTRTRLDSTRAEQFTATYFADDVQAARSTGGVVTAGTAQCGTRALLVEFRGDTYDPAAVTTSRSAVTTYSLVAVTVDGAAARELHRLTCEAAVGAATPLTPVRDQVVARGLADVNGTVTVNGAQVSLTLTRLDGTTFTLLGKRRTT